MVVNAEYLPSGALLPCTEDWAALSDSIKQYDADVIVLVARKMPRLVEALRLNLGDRAICVSDHAIPFMHDDLSNARVAIVDDVWNVGSTMMRAQRRVESANPRAVRLFALGARNAPAARELGAHLAIPRSLAPDQYRSIVDSVPRALSLMPKPYDVDFPIIPCLLRPGFRSWEDCWCWLKAQFGDYAHSTVDEVQLAAGYARATVNFVGDANWRVKARLYFDLRESVCNLVPMALTPNLSRTNDYPSDTLSSAMFDVLTRALEGAQMSSSDINVGAHSDAGEETDGPARAKIFCDSLLITRMILESFDGLLQRETLEPFSRIDFSMQFGRSVVDSYTQLSNSTFHELTRNEFESYVCDRQVLEGATSYSLLSEDRISGRARELLVNGFPILALDALLTDLGDAVGADQPDEYALRKPYTPDEIKLEPYLRLRLGFTYEEIVGFFRENLNELWTGSQQVELVVSSLIDLFIDRGAIVPTFTLHHNACHRVYRKGEANSRWEDEVARCLYALDALGEAERADLVDRNRTRVAKIIAIMSFSNTIDTDLTVGALERGTVGMLKPSVVEQRGRELTGYMRRIGKWT